MKFFPLSGCLTTIFVQVFVVQDEAHIIHLHWSQLITRPLEACISSLNIFRSKTHNIWTESIERKFSTSIVISRYNFKILSISSSTHQHELMSAYTCSLFYLSNIVLPNLQLNSTRRIYKNALSKPHFPSDNYLGSRRTTLPQMFT